MAPVTQLFLIIFLEGYVVLSTELLAIRVLMPFTGTGTDTVSIIIAAVLLPLAFGYYAGGVFKKRSRAGKTAITVRGKLVTNLVVSSAILMLGLSYAFLDYAFVRFQEATNIYNRLTLTAIYTALFIVYPVFLLGQTVPLVSNYFSREKLSYMAGRILFFSTLGSFMGAVFCTLVLMNTLGVHHTVSITIACMALLTFLLARKKVSAPVIISLVCVGITLALNSSYMMKRMHIVGNNMYSTVQVEDVDGDFSIRALKLNRSLASQIYRYSDEIYVDYIAYIEETFITTIPEDGPEKSILILGAGGFTLGRYDEKNKYVFVDIDPQLKDISENLFLQEKLTPNKTFVPMDARAYLLQSKEKFDLIIIDLCRDPVNMPENLVTREFYEEVRDHMAEGGIVVWNQWASPTFNDKYSSNLDITLHSVFPVMNRQIINSYDPWKQENNWVNVIYSAVANPRQKLSVYTDDKNTAALDRPVNIPH